MNTAVMTYKCGHCGQPEHSGVCPTIKAIEYFANGKIKRVEYKTPADYAAPFMPYPWPVQPQLPYNPPVPPYWTTTCVVGKVDTTQFGGVTHNDRN